MAPKKLQKKLRKEEKVKKAIIIEKKEIVQKYESGVRLIDLANMYSMSKFTLFYYTKVR
jgi:aryl-alcohol dehydrogenase-like predicted oxidoreductase